MRIVRKHVFTSRYDETMKRGSVFFASTCVSNRIRDRRHNFGAVCGAIVFVLVERKEDANFGHQQREQTSPYFPYTRALRGVQTRVAYGSDPCLQDKDVRAEQFC